MKTTLSLRNLLLLLLIVTLGLGSLSAVFVRFGFTRFQEINQQDRKNRALSHSINTALSDFRKSRSLSNDFLLSTKNIRGFYQAKLNFLPEFHIAVTDATNELNKAAELANQTAPEDLDNNIYRLTGRQLHHYNQSFKGLVNITERLMQQEHHAQQHYNQLETQLGVIAKQWQQYQLLTLLLKIRLINPHKHPTIGTREAIFLRLIAELVKKIAALPLPADSKTRLQHSLSAYHQAIIAWFAAQSSNNAAIERFAMVKFRIDSTLEKLQYDKQFASDRLLAKLPQMLEWIPYAVLGVTITMVGLTALLVWIVAMKFNRGIDHLLKGVGRVALGKLEQPVSLNSTDELGTLASSFNQMAADLAASTRVVTNAKEYIENIFDSMLDTLIVLNLDCTIRTANPAALVLLGYDEHELLGKSIHDVAVAKEQTLSVKSTIDKIINKIINEGRVHNIEVGYQSSNGILLPMLFSAALMHNEDVDRQGIVCVAKDLSQRKQAETIIEQSNHKLRAINDQLLNTQAQLVQSAKLASIGRIAAGLAHELNQPLGTIKLCAQLCKRFVNDDSRNTQKVLGKLDDIIAQVLRSDKIIKHLKTFSHHGKGQRQKTDLNWLINDALTLFIEPFKIGGITLTTELADGLPEIDCEHIQIEQVLINLLTNARDALEGAQQALITVSSYSDNEKIYIEVEDTGCGMGPSVLDKIFDPFFTTKPVGKGTGLGMSISYGIIKDHHGELSAVSREGHGSRFTVSLPASS